MVGYAIGSIIQTRVQTPSIYKSSQTYGLRLTNYLKQGDSFQLNDNYGLQYTAEWVSNQITKVTQITIRYTANNRWAALPLICFLFKARLEQLDGVGKNKAFQTPLGYNFAFQGWADHSWSPWQWYSGMYSAQSLPAGSAGSRLNGGLPWFFRWYGHIIMDRNGTFSVPRNSESTIRCWARYAYYNADHYSQYPKTYGCRQHYF